LTNARYTNSAATLLPLDYPRGGRDETLRIASCRVALKTTVAFDTYWRFAVERQAMFFRRLWGRELITEDPILASYRFTNAYRASDRVSQFLISYVIPDSYSAVDTVFRILLFKFFNRIGTWQYLESRFGGVHYEDFSIQAYDHALSEELQRGGRLYSAAYIIPSPQFGSDRKHSNHLALLSMMMHDGFVSRLLEATSLKNVYDLLRSYPSLGSFLAFQFAIDLNYSPLMNFSEMDFVVAGPGAIDGIRKCFADTAGYSNEDVIKILAEIAAMQFEKLEVPFLSLWGRPLQLIDCQNLLCEVDKYSRVAHPELNGVSGRVRIKQRFVRNTEPLEVRYPAKWGLSTETLPDPPALSCTLM
jgi:hypothetical protein